jgi:hypothetical protein
MTPYIHDVPLLRLTDDEIADPYPVIANLCQEYTIADVREKLEGLKDIALCEDGIYNDSKKRASLIYFMKMLERALEANYLIMAQRPPASAE